MRSPIQENAADEQELALAQFLQSELRREQLAEDRQQLSTQEGRAWVWGELERSGIFEDISGPIEQVYAALGRRRHGLALLIRTQQHREQFFQMWGEALKRRSKHAERVAAARTTKKRRHE